jgi:DNA-binding Xre family transcriptional regulator
MMRLRVRELAEARGIGLSKLSRLADVNYKTVQTIWRDPFHGVNTKTLERIAKALNVPMSELFEDVPDEEF